MERRVRMRKRIVILGGGYGGVYAGKLLHKKLRKEKDIEIVLIDKKPYHTLMTELHEVAGNRTPEDSVKVELSKIFANRKVQVVLDEVEEIDFEKRQLKSAKNQTYDYDYLVIGTGARPTFYGVEGADQYAFTLWSYEDALVIREHILEMFRKAEIETDPIKRRELLTFVVVGGGFTGVELVGEIVEWSKKLCKEYEINHEELRIINVDALPSIVTNLSEKLQRKAIRHLEKIGVEVILNAPISQVSEKSVLINEGEKIITNTCIWTAGVKSSEFSERLGLTPGHNGGIKTNAYMQSVDYKNVYVVGDNVSYIEEGVGPLPKIVETAHFTAETAVHNIVADLKEKEKVEHKSNYHGVMVSLGSKYAVASLGGNKKRDFSGWFAMLMKHMVNMFYLLQIAGINRVWKYLMHEFFHIKDRRSFVGGHFSKASPNFWLVPLRLYLGVMWLIEGINKINQGWLKEAKMVASNAVSGATPMSDATAAASAVAEAAAEYGEPLIKNVPSIIQWGIDHVVAPYAIPFQTIMVLAEIVIGLCLIAGLFTFLSSVISVGMTVAIALTGMADASILWFFFGGIALIGGSGSTFGLDYYVLPWLKAHWKKIGLVQKSYMYFD
jgi:NADH dehydrogenase